MANADNIESVIMKTFTEASETGFESDRVQAILNQTELSLKKQKDDFGWRMIMNLTHGWNHVSNPLDLLTINPILDRFRQDIQNPSFLKNKVKEYFVGNQHRLTLTMSPKEDYLEKQEEVLQNLEDSLVKKLSPEARNKAIEQGTVWKCTNFSVLQILREIDFCGFSASKSAISTVLVSLNISFGYFLFNLPGLKYAKNQNSGPLKLLIW